MSKALFWACLIGAAAAFIAWGGGTDFAAYGKAIVIGLVSGYIALRASLSLTEVEKARLGLDRVRRVLDFERQAAPAEGQMPTPYISEIVEFEELKTSALARGGQTGASEVLARRLGDRYLAKVPLARFTAASAVYVGLGGTLLGLTFAVLGLRSLGGDPDRMKEQILGVVSGFGGSFACAFCGIVATVWLSHALARHDAEVTDIEASAEAYVAETLVPQSLESRRAADDQRIAELMTQTVAKGLAAELGGFWTPLLGAADALEKAAGNIEKQAQAIAKSAEDAQKVGEERIKAIGEANTEAHEINRKTQELQKDLASLVKSLLSAASTLPEMLRAIQATGKSMDDSVKRIEPALVSIDKFGKAVAGAEKAMSEVELGVKGIAAAVREETKVASKEMTLEVARQQSELAKAIDPSLAQIARAMDLLRVVVERTEEAARDLPIALPSARIVQDLRTVADEQKRVAQRDSASVHEAADRLAKTEERIGQAIAAVWSAHEELRKSLEALGVQTSGVAQHLDEVTERLDTPFWKRLAGRKP